MKNSLQFRRIKFIITALCAVVLLDACNPADSSDVQPVAVNVVDKIPSTIASQWAELQLALTKRTAGYTPPVASRAYGLAGLTMYESVVAGMPEKRSLAGQLSKLTSLPTIDAAKQYNYGLSLNAGQASILRNLYAEASRPQAVANKKSIDSLETLIATSLRTGVSQDIIDRSIAYGDTVARSIFAWSIDDGGHQGYKRNFPTTYVIPVFPGAWQKTENGQSPMQPYWGANRTFVTANAYISPVDPIPFSTSTTSAYFKAYKEVYDKNITLTATEKEIAVWWADNPVDTPTPPGHSYSIANIAVKKAGVGLGKAAEAFARTGIAVADAFILCWKCKYTYMNERPYTMVNRMIAKWTPFWPAPPFPGYMSGHATQSSASAEVLTAMFGENFAFTDNSNEGMGIETKTNTPYKVRSFSSFRAAAEESAMSRFYGGIHTKQDNEIGLQEGKKVGVNINALKFNK
jgi:hypothetical protein